MNSSQLQKLQEMQRLQQQMQQQIAQRQQQAAGQRQTQQQQQQLLSSGSLSNLPQMQQMQVQGYGNQQWMDPSQQQGLGSVQQQRNSLTGMSNSMAMMQQQHGGQAMGVAGGNAQNAFYWNALQGNKGSSGGMGTGMDPSGNSSSLAAMAGMGMGMGGSSSQLGMMDTNSMQALLQQQHQGGSMSMGNNQQQMLGMGQQQLSNKDLSSAMGGMNSSSGMMGGQSAQQMQMLQKMGGSSSSLLGNNSGRGDISAQGQQLQASSSSSSNNAQLLLQQQTMIADLKRQLQAQQASAGGGSDARSSSSMMSTQQQQQLLQQMQHRGSANSSMLHQMTSGMMNDSSRAQLLQRQSSNSSLGGGNKGRQGSLGHSEPISIAQLMGHQSGQQNSVNTMSQLGGQSMGNSSGSSLRGSQLQSNSMFDGTSGSSSQQNMFLQQQLQQQMAKSGMDSLSKSASNRSGSINEQILAQQQQILSASGMSQADIQKAQQLLMGQSMGMGQTMSSMPSMTQSASRSNSQVHGNLASSGMSQPLTNAADPLMDGLKGAPDTLGGSNHGADGNEKPDNDLDDLDSSIRGKARKGSNHSRGSTGKKKDDTGPNSQSFLDGTFAGGWQSNADIPDRRRVIYSICKVIEQMRPDASKMSQKLPFMAKRLEEHLYRSAQTKEEYLDSSTLKKRLQLIAHGLESHRTTSGGSTDEPKASSSPAPLPLQSGQSGTIGASSAGGGTSDASSKLQLQMQLAQLQQLQQLQQQQQQKLGGVNKGLMDNLNPMMLKQSGLTQEDMFREQAKQLSAQQGSLSGASASGYPSVFGQAGSQMTAAQLQDSILKAQQSQSSAKLPTMSRRASSEATAGILKNSSKYQDPQKRKVIKQQQQRLLLLRHASKCKNGPNCKVKFCGQMVQLWKHMKKCRDKNCKTAHCLSSRCVLNHYRICKSENKTSSCEVCGPVMRQIKQQQNSEKQDDLEPLPASKDDLILSDPDLLPGTVVAPDMARQGSKSAVQIQSADEALAAQTLNQIDLQAAQLKLQQQTMLLKQLQQQQAELMEQQQRLQQQQQHVLPQTQQGQQLQQQQALLQQLQQQFQQQQLLLQQELIRQSQALQSGQAAAAQLSQMSQGEQMSQVSQLSQIPAGGLDLGPDGKPKKRAAAAPRRVSKKSLERQLSGLGKQAKQVRGRGSGKGKRFSDLESQICGDDHSSVQSSDFVSSAVKRSAGDLVGSIGMEDLIDEPPTKAIKLERVHSGSILDPTIPENRVLEQGDCDHTTSLVPSMPQEAIEQHLASLQNGMHMTPRAISSKCLPVIRRMLDDQFGWVFRDPVDPVVLGLPDYFDVVKNPMHLALIEQNVENGVYRDMATFERDTKLVFENAILYNGEESEVGEMAKTMLTNFAMDFTGVVDGLGAGAAGLTKRGDVCSLCDSQRRLFEPTVLYCNGACGMQKIRRGAQYYTDRTKSNHWCTSCFSLLKDDESIVLDDGCEIKKHDLQKLKNDATPEEAWVQCDKCDSWVHQICALFNGRKNKSKAAYLCPKCHLDKVVKGEAKKPDIPMKAAKDLPHSNMSMAIENGLHGALQKAYAQQAFERGIPIENVSRAEGLSVRVISNMEKKHVVRDEMYDRYAKTGCPTEFPVRSKCIALFQTIHGVDVILFGMYVFEYNHDCPAPNRRRVYVSYLDSVNYFEPQEYRTLTYHSIIIEYLRYVKDRGFHTAHIWSCPPSPGDEYIFHCHPAKQMVPRDDRLCQWYLSMLEKAKAEGVVLNIRTLYDEYFKNGGMDATNGPASDPTCLPYFEGDYIPGEIENIIKEVKADEEIKRKGREDLPTVTNGEVVGNRRGTRSNPGEMVHMGQDKVMLRLGLAMSNMKQNFLIADLRSRDFAAAVEAGDDVSDWREDDEDQLGSKRPKIRGKDSSVLDPNPVLQSVVKVEVDHRKVEANTEVAVKMEPGPKPHGLNTPADVPSTDASVQQTASEKDDDNCSLGTVSVALDHGDDSPANVFGESADLSTTSEPKSTAHEVSDLEGRHIQNGVQAKKEHEFTLDTEHLNQQLDGKVGEGIKKEENIDNIGEKRGFEEMGAAIAKHFAGVKAASKPLASTADEDEPQEFEMFESRQQFLNYCQTNHFQFDELRRAKHTTMMVLFQLHNPNAPKFLENCGACFREIAHGSRYHCNECANFNLCEDCYEPVTTGQFAQQNARFSHDSSHSFSPINVEIPNNEQKNREERSRSIKVHLELLAHAASCDGPPGCALNNCQRMKKLFEHVRDCNVIPKKACKICTRILTLLAVHARLCTVRGSCPLPFCDRIREKNRRRRQQQQLMDDRRRQTQNKLYRANEEGDL